MDSKTEDTTNKLNQMDSPEDLDVFVKELMDNMVCWKGYQSTHFISNNFLFSSFLSKQSRFSRLSDTILGRIDDMGSKIDDLEKSIGELMDQAGIEPTADVNAASRPKA